MALTLNYSTLLANDNSTIQITDTTTNWGAPNIAISDLNGTNYSLYLNIVLQTTSATYTYDTIDLYSGILTNQGPWITQAGLVWDIKPTDLYIGGVVSTATTFEDGIFTITYSVNISAGTQLESKFVMYGNVKNTLYNKAMQLDLNYLSQDENLWQAYPSRHTANILQEKALLFNLEASAYTARTTDLLNTLRALQTIQLHGSNTNWK